MSPGAESKFEPIITKLRPAQIEGALALFVVQLKEHDIVVDTRKVREVVEKVIADERHGFIVIASTEGGRIVGAAFSSAFLGLEHGGESGWLEELYVLPEYRQKGVGTRLVAAVVRVARERGWRALDLEVEANHQRVVSLYARQGFQPRTRSRFFLNLD